MAITKNNIMTPWRWRSKSPVPRSGGPKRPRRRNARLVTAVDLGTTKVCVIIGELNDDKMINVLGVGSAPSRGIQRGVVTNINQTVESLKQAFEAANELARVKPGEALVGIAGDHITGLNTTGITDVGNPEGGIDQRDIRKAREKALRLTHPEDMEVIHNFVQEYIVDGTHGVTDPERMFGQRLEARMHVVTASTSAANNIFKCVKLASLRTSSIALQSLASSLAVLDQKERDMGVILLDIGGGTTDIAVFHNGTLQYISEIAMGGDIITSDISKMLRCSLHDAENLKKRLGHAEPLQVDSDEWTEIRRAAERSPKARISRRQLAEIIEARVEEIFDISNRHLHRSGLADKMLSGVVITGGAAMLEGIDSVASRIFELPCRIGRPEGVLGLSGVINTPIYSTAIGLIHWASEEGAGFQRANWFTRKFKEVFDIYA